MNLIRRPTCLICRADGVVMYSRMKDRLYPVKGSWDILKCPNCGLLWLDPCPDPKEIGKLYIQYHTHITRQPNTRRLSRWRRLVQDSLLAYSFGYPTRIMHPNLIGAFLSRVSLLRDNVGSHIMMLDNSIRGKLLDIGTGNGEFLKTMRELAWDVTGIEPDESAASIARRVYDLRVYTQALDETDLPEQSFDVVTMDHVIEHLYDPKRGVQKIHRLLKYGGYLVMLTPNAKSYLHAEFQNSWLHLDPPRHYFIFSVDSLQKVVEQGGFRVEKTRTVSSSTWWVWIASRWIHSHGVIVNGQLPRRELHLLMKLRGLFHELIEESLRLGILSKPRPAGEEIYLMARKV